jgi:CubicO group peptidase (beta-lactamase class C family)
MNNRRLKVILWTVAAAVAVQSPAFAQAQIAPPSDLDAYVERVMFTFEVPGVGLAIVKDGQVVLTKGYGVRSLGEEARVDEHTLFGIASNTKAFTATALGMLVEEGVLEWDAPVVEYLPWFRLSDPLVTRELTIRDLLVHRSGLGLGAGDLLWWPPSTYDRKEIARRLRHLPLATSFRSAYAYDNVLYTVAGEVIEELTGESWEDFISARILAPVGMLESNVRHSDVSTGGNIATTHARIEGIVRPVKPFASDNTNPAGGINASASDMARWLIVQLDSGRVGANRLYSQRTAREMWSLVTPIAVGTPSQELRALRSSFNGYGLGFFVRDYRGQKLVTHTGGLPGYVSRVAMLPDHKIGVAVLTNQESGAAFNAIAWHVLDYYLGADDTDWLAAYEAVMTRFETQMTAMDDGTAAARKPDAEPSLPLPDYVGTYNDPWYGDVSFEMRDGGLVIRFEHTPVLIGNLEHWQYDTFVARWWDRELRADAFVTFVLGPTGRVVEARMQAASRRTDFSFDFHDLRLTPKRSR